MASSPVEWQILSGLDDEATSRLLQRARRRTFKRQEVVFHRGDPADAMHLIVRGRFAVRVHTALGDTGILTVVGPSEVFGELALLEDHGIRSATVLALEPAETRSLHRLDFDALRRHDPGVSQILAVALAERVRRLSELLIEAWYVPADTRILRRLQELVGQYATERADEVIVPLTQDELAALAGTSRATVNRVLREAERRGEVEVQRGRTVVRDPAGVARRASRGG